MVKKTKQCTKCKVIKPLGEFHKDKTRKDGLSIRCKVCSAIALKKYRESEGGKAQTKKWRQEHKKNIMPGVKNGLRITQRKYKFQIKNTGKRTKML